MSKHLKEFELIARIERLAAKTSARVLKSIGDDAAILRPARGHDLVWATDAQVEDVHFRRAWMNPRDIGWRALAVNLSDLAAMGATPLGALVSIAIPESWSDADVLALHRGVVACGKKFSCPLIGGNVSSAKGRSLQVHVSVLGEVRRGRALRRDAARVGEDLWVTGQLGVGGASLDALRRGASAARIYLKPDPPLAFAKALAEKGLSRAAIDVSDGLLADLAHVLEASGNLGAQIELAKVPVPVGLRKLQRADDPQPLAAALNRGEDYQLLFSAPAGKRTAVESLARATKVKATRIGALVKAPGITLLTSQGLTLPYAGPGGWQHRR